MPKTLLPLALTGICLAVPASAGTQDEELRLVGYLYECEASAAYEMIEVTGKLITSENGEYRYFTAEIDKVQADAYAKVYSSDKSDEPWLFTGKSWWGAYWYTYRFDKDAAQLPAFDTGKLRFMIEGSRPLAKSLAIHFEDQRNGNANIVGFGQRHDKKSASFSLSLGSVLNYGANSDKLWWAVQKYPYKGIVVSIGKRYGHGGFDMKRLRSAQMPYDMMREELNRMAEDRINSCEKQPEYEDPNAIMV